MKALVLRLKEFATRLLDIILMAAYPPPSRKADDWWNYVDY